MASFFEVMIERNFSSAHQLRGYKGMCENLHGHNCRAEIYAKSKKLNNIGFAHRFWRTKKSCQRIVAYLDHCNLNELPPFDEELKKGPSFSDDPGEKNCCRRY
jgi:6-pyruvoyltetrahydropterin/6-carboxytetrahydropterin synthase